MSGLERTVSRAAAPIPGGTASAATTAPPAVAALVAVADGSLEADVRDYLNRGRWEEEAADHEWEIEEESC